MGGGSKNKYANRKKNKQERKKQLDNSSSAEKSSDDVKDSSDFNDDVEVEMKSEVMSTTQNWEVEENTNDFKDNDESDWNNPQDLQQRPKEEEIVQESKVRNDDFPSGTSGYEKPRYQGKQWGRDKEPRHQTDIRDYYSRSRNNYEEKRSYNTRDNYHYNKDDHVQRSEIRRDNNLSSNRWVRHETSSRNDWDTDREKTDNDGDKKDLGNSDNYRRRRDDQKYYENRNVNRRSSRSRDREYDNWYSNFRDKVKDENTNVIEVFGDLFCVDDDYALGHCVAEDMNMGSGIATEFRSKFKRVDELLQQKVKQGDVATLHIDNRYIYYLVTKRYSSGKPTYETLFRALRKMKEHAERYNVKKIALPRIGCGLDGLEWRTVKSMLQFIFDGVNIEIKIYNFQQELSNPMQPPKRKCIVKNVLKSVVNIEAWTLIIYPCSKDRVITKHMEDLDKKFNIQNDFRKSNKELGSIIRTNHPLNYIVYGVVVKEKSEDPIDFVLFQKCINEIHKLNSKKQDKYYYVAMEAFKDRHDYMVITKLVNLMRNTFHSDVAIYICWPDELKDLAPRELEYS